MCGPAQQAPPPKTTLHLGLTCIYFLAPSFLCSLCFVWIQKFRFVKPRSSEFINSPAQIWKFRLGQPVNCIYCIWVKIPPPSMRHHDPLKMLYLWDGGRHWPYLLWVCLGIKARGGDLGGPSHQLQSSCLASSGHIWQPAHFCRNACICCGRDEEGPALQCKDKKLGGLDQGWMWVHCVHDSRKNRVVIMCSTINISAFINTSNTQK